jgi:hypothetical protein
MGTMGENIAQPEKRPLAEARALVVPVSRNGPKVHNGHNVKRAWFLVNRTTVEWVDFLALPGLAWVNTEAKK